MQDESSEHFQTFRSRKTIALYELKRKLPMLNEIVSQSTILCEDYIYSRLHKPDVQTSAFDESFTGHRRPSDVSREIQRLGAMMESKYPELYCNISRQIMMPLRSEVSVRKALVCIGDYMFKNNVVTWGRIVGLFAVTAALARETVQAGHEEHIRIIISVFSELIERHASVWIYRHGGWVRISGAFRSRMETNSIWALTVIGALLGFFVTWSIQS